LLPSFRARRPPTTALKTLHRASLARNQSNLNATAASAAQKARSREFRRKIVDLAARTPTFGDEPQETILFT
jgi:hypothetical protein